ncbi:MAG: SCO family protein [Planctomycetota bacterium]
MDQKPNDVAGRRSFFQTPAFWTGSVLWLVVLAAGIAAFNRPSRQRSELTAGERDRTPRPDVVVATNTAAAIPADDGGDEAPPEIRITTDKNGNAKVVLPGENPESPWDKDGIADFEFEDSEGNKISRKNLLGKPWIVCFVFTHCAATCPRVTLSMRELQDQLKKSDFRMVTMTVDPIRDTPEVLREYGKSRGANFKKWSFVTGDQREIYRLIHGSFKMPVQELEEPKKVYGFEFIHSNNIMLVDETGVVKGKFDATKPTAMAELRRTIQKLAKPIEPKSGEASDAKPDAEKTDEKPAEAKTGTE